MLTWQKKNSSFFFIFLFLFFFITKTPHYYLQRLFFQPISDQAQSFEFGFENPRKKSSPMICGSRKQEAMTLGHQLGPKCNSAHLAPNPHLLPWCGTCWNNSKRRGKLSRKVQKKGKERETHVMLSFPPLFITKLKAIKKSPFPRWAMDHKASLL